MDKNKNSQTEQKTSGGDLRQGGVSSGKNDQLEKIHSVLDAGSQVLIRVSTVFPFKFFPTTIVVGKSKLDIIYRFFATTRTESILISNIVSVKMETAFIFASIEIETDVPHTQAIKISTLPISKARQLVDLVQGLMISYDMKAELSSVSSDHLKQPLKQIGRTKL
ncbi:MAG: hypothetical protein ACOZAN_04130 [Patescibacteria group bacterium]